MVLNPEPQLQENRGACYGCSADHRYCVTHFFSFCEKKKIRNWFSFSFSQEALTSLDFFRWVVFKSSPTKCHPCVMERMKTNRRLLLLFLRIWSFSLFNIIIVYNLLTVLKCWVWIQSLAICSKQYFNYYMTVLQNWCPCIFFLSIGKKDIEAFSFKLLLFFLSLHNHNYIFLAWTSPFRLLLSGNKNAAYGEWLVLLFPYKKEFTGGTEKVEHLEDKTQLQCCCILFRLLQHLKVTWKTDGKSYQGMMHEISNYIHTHTEKKNLNLFCLI